MVEFKLFVKTPSSARCLHWFRATVNNVGHQHRKQFERGKRWRRAISACPYLCKKKVRGHVEYNNSECPPLTCLLFFTCTPSDLGCRFGVKSSKMRRGLSDSQKQLVHSTPRMEKNNKLAMFTGQTRIARVCELDYRVSNYLSALSTWNRKPLYFFDSETRQDIHNTCILNMFMIIELKINLWEVEKWHVTCT